MSRKRLLVWVGIGLVPFIGAIALLANLETRTEALKAGVTVAEHKNQLEEETRQAAIEKDAARAEEGTEKERAEEAERAEKAKKDAEHDVAVYGLTVCQSEVKKRLVSPGTADFPWLDREITLNQQTGEAIIRSYVDAQNRMGGTIRADWVCIVKGSGEQWSIVELAMQER